MMIRKVQIELQCFDGLEFAQQVAELAEALTAVNMWEISTDEKSLPCCLKCGQVQYEQPMHCDDTSTCQRIRDARGIYRARLGTCLDLACERAARLRLAGHRAHVVITHDGPMTRDFHAYVESDIGDQDPSEELQAQNTPESCGCGNHASEAP